MSTIASASFTRSSRCRSLPRSSLTAPSRRCIRPLPNSVSPGLASAGPPRSSTRCANCTPRASLILRSARSSASLATRCTPFATAVSTCQRIKLASATLSAVQSRPSARRSASRRAVNFGSSDSRTMPSATAGRRSGRDVSGIRRLPRSERLHPAQGEGLGRSHPQEGERGHAPDPVDHPQRRRGTAHLHGDASAPDLRLSGPRAGLDGLLTAG